MFNKSISLDLGRSKFDVKIGDFISESQFKEKFSSSLENDQLIVIISSLVYAKDLSSDKGFLILQLL